MEIEPDGEWHHVRVPESNQTDRRAPPQHSPSPRELDDLELLNNGALAPLTGFEGPNGLVTLHVPRAVGDAAIQAGELELVDPEGVPLAMVAVESTYERSNDLSGIQGEVIPNAHTELGAYRRHYLSPMEVRQKYGEDTLTVPVDGPLTDLELARITGAAKGRPVVLLALAGHGTPQGLTASGLIRATLAAATALQDADVVAVPLASRGETGPPWAPLSAVDDQVFRERVTAAYAPGEVFMGLTGEGELPEAIAEVVAFERPPRDKQGLVLFFTGLSGSGKSTLARAQHDLILERRERTVTSLDGDVVRRNLSAGLTFSKEDRETIIRRIGWVAAEISRHRGIAICSPIAPFDSTREQVRSMVEEAGGAFVLIHVATPLEECERRDRKGLYARARRGEIPDFTGISSPYEVPADPAVRVDTTGRSIEDALDEVLKVLDDEGYLSRSVEPNPAVEPVETRGAHR